MINPMKGAWILVLALNFLSTKANEGKGKNSLVQFKKFHWDQDQIIEDQVPSVSKRREGEFRRGRVRTLMKLTRPHKRQR